MDTSNSLQPLAKAYYQQLTTAAGTEQGAALRQRGDEFLKSLEGQGSRTQQAFVNVSRGIASSSLMSDENAHTVHTATLKILAGTLPDRFSLPTLLSVFEGSKENLLRFTVAAGIHNLRSSQAGAEADIHAADSTRLLSRSEAAVAAHSSRWAQKWLSQSDESKRDESEWRLQQVQNRFKAEDIGRSGRAEAAHVVRRYEVLANATAI